MNKCGRMALVILGSKDVQMPIQQSSRTLSMPNQAHAVSLPQLFGCLHLLWGRLRCCLCATPRNLAVCQGCSKQLGAWWLLLPTVLMLAAILLEAPVLRVNVAASTLMFMLRWQKKSSWMMQASQILANHTSCSVFHPTSMIRNHHRPFIRVHTLVT